MEPEKKEVSSAAFVPTKSIAQFVIEEILKGLKVKVKIGDWTGTGYIHQLDFVSGGDYVFATVAVPDPDREDGEDIDVRVSINKDGTILVLPD